MVCCEGGYFKVVDAGMGVYNGGVLCLVWMVAEIWGRRVLWDLGW
jgi:hypothetical protein